DPIRRDRGFHFISRQDRLRRGDSAAHADPLAITQSDRSRYHLHGVAGRGAGESQALRSRQAAAGRGPRQRRPQADRLYPAIPSASLSPVATVLRRRSGGTTIGAPTWKTASPSCSTTWALMAAGNSFSPPRPPFAPSYSCSTDWPSSSARLVADL